MTQNTVSVLDSSGHPVPAAKIAGLKAAATVGQFRAAYEGAGHNHPSTRNWNASRLSGAAAASMSRETISQRVRELERNDGPTATAVDKKLNAVVGAHWQLSPKPNAKKLGLSLQQTKEISAQIKAEWEDYAYGLGFWSDMERDGDADDQLMLMARHVCLDGEGFGVLGYRESPTGYGTAMQIVHPARCSNPNNCMDTETLRDGVEVDDNGVSTAYHFRKAHPGDMQVANLDRFTWQRFARETVWGRAITLHVRYKREAGMKRAISEFAPVLRVSKQGEKLTDYELQASMLNAVMGVFVKTPNDASAMLDAIASGGNDNTAQEAYALNRAYHAENPIDMDGVKVHALGMGEEVETLVSNHPNANFEPFMKTVLRSIASRLGITYEQLTGDWSEVNYSSARAAILEVAKGFAVVSGLLKKQFMTPWYAAFLEEAFALGRIELPKGIPTFDEAPQAWSHAKWIGMGQGYIDPDKEVSAAMKRVASGLSSKQREIALQGDTFEEVAQEIAWEREYDELLGNNAHSCADHASTGAGRPPQVEPEEKSPAEEKKAQRASIVPKVARYAA